jgi:cysteinyl-tRNA synthetase
MLDELNIKRPEIICHATDHITSMIRFIEVLEKKGFTYQIADGIYFDTSKFPDYGRLSGQTFAKLQKSLKAGARVEVAVGKKHPTDFALWKLTPPGVKRQMEWNSPWGKGFPGWHLECSAMSMKYLGETIDIHTGGIDHIPIHHSNEIAQSEAATGKPFVRFWLHAQHLLVDGQKMSKSLNNFYRVVDIEEKKCEPLALRYLFLTAHYGTAMNFTWKSMEAAQNALAGLHAQISTLKSQILNRKRVSLSEEKLNKINKFRVEFTAAINDDLNTAKALSIVWKVIKSNIPPEDKYDLLLLFDEVLGLDFSKPDIKGGKLRIPNDINLLIKKREQLRYEKKFEEADKIRKELEDKGYKIEDSSTGPIISTTKIKRLT